MSFVLILCIFSDGKVSERHIRLPVIISSVSNFAPNILCAYIVVSLFASVVDPNVALVAIHLISSLYLCILSLNLLMRNAIQFLMHRNMYALRPIPKI